MPNLVDDGFDITSVSTLLETCEQARYGAPLGKENLAEEVSRAKGLIDQLEKTLR